MESTPTFAYSDSFIPAGPRKKRKGKTREAPPSPLILLERAQEEITSGDWFSECREILQGALRDTSIDCPEVLCLGLGNPCSSRDARAQLAFLIRLCASFDIAPSTVSVYDPVFTDADQELFQVLGMTPLKDNKALGCPTILYMPHCGIKLYENILRENWTAPQLATIVFIANRLGEYVDNNPAFKLNRDYPCLNRLVPHLNSRPLPTSTAYSTAFNNLSVQYVKRTVLASLDDAFWERPASPPSTNSC
ncbi:SRR1-domain-containing protein [Hygrophoropsis aurantiaca]|uniref:SRR1-domain-containing protein n=1 Tax=Hygrophoropsis aurantiaca TaxID=72124 RepID=A0ACB8AFQ8_9AGAM|nr:SRR1-domain-containing protein [Hygrophoropsis aurantiaca]